MADYQMESLSAEINLRRRNWRELVLMSGPRARRRTALRCRCSRPDQPHGVYFSGVNDPAFRNITFDGLVAAYRGPPKRWWKVARI